MAADEQVHMAAHWQLFLIQQPLPTVVTTHLSSSSSSCRASVLRWNELCGAVSEVRWRSNDDMLRREPRSGSGRSEK